jgi:3-dehydroquinate synthase
MPRIDIKTASAHSSMLIEFGALRGLGETVRSCAPHSRALLAVDANVANTHGDAAAQSLTDAGYAVTIAPICAEETHKTIATAETLWAAMLRSKMERTSPVIALGGGIVGDIAGFAAATFLRGVPLVQVPTTLLAMVDASIGGKTGVNSLLPDGSLGKNLIGAFHQPLAIVADPAALSTLPKRDFACGLAECIKHALIADATLLDFIEKSIAAIVAKDKSVLVDLIHRCAAIKIAIVESDEHEQGQRALLNLGHTFAHAIEPLPELHLRHGEAVAIGLIAAMHCSVRTGRMTPGEAQRVQEIIDRCGLPTRMNEAIDTDVLLERMRYDKKVTDAQMRLILPVGIGRAEIVKDVAPQIVRSAWQSAGAH